MNHAPRHTAGRDRSGEQSRSGQTLIFVVMVVVILSFVVLWNIDLHKVIYVKSLSQNAGDAAALAGARWQAITLNLIGDLNVMQAVALTQGDTNQAADINDLQARLCYVGPMIGLEAAQQAAKNNGVFNNERFSARLEAHAGEVLNEYTALGADGRMLFAEPYPDCWKEYAAMIEAVALNGVAAGPDNAHYYSDIQGGSILLSLDFYDAVAGEDWCWFYHHAYPLLQTYVDYRSWPPLPPVIPQPDPINSEYYGLGLKRQERVVSTEVLTLLDQARQERGLSSVPIPVSGTVTSVWYCYDQAIWSAWDSISPFGENAFPAAGTVKSQYDYAGADAAARVMTEATRLTPGSDPKRSFLTWDRNPSEAVPAVSKITWTAAAKPFGYLEVNEQPVRPNIYDLVIPAFRDIRLIPLDASSALAGGAFDLVWRDHIERHLPDYMESGRRVAGCWYCQQLGTWDNPVFRQTGINWLKLNSGNCQETGGPGGRGGGARRGH